MTTRADIPDLGPDPQRWAYEFIAAHPVRTDVVDWFAAAIRSGRDAQRDDFLEAARTPPAWPPPFEDHQDYHL